VTNVIEVNTSNGILEELFEILSPGLATLIDSKLMTSLGSGYQYQVSIEKVLIAAQIFFCCKFIHPISS
jgi:hypothetical protein